MRGVRAQYCSNSPPNFACRYGGGAHQHQSGQEEQAGNDTSLLGTSGGSQEQEKCGRKESGDRDPVRGDKIRQA